MNTAKPLPMICQKSDEKVAAHRATHLLSSLRLILLTFLCGLLGSTLSMAQTPVALMYDTNIEGIKFAATDVKAALQQNGFTVTELPLGDPAAVTPSVRVILSTVGVSISGKPVITGITQQGYAIRKVVSGPITNWWIIGFDNPGAMYGGLEFAEAVKLADGLTGVTERTTNPHIVSRGIKFNIPLDARSPSYSDDSSSAQANIVNMWEQSYWIGFLDNMARHRYNMLSLWSLHPFPSMVRVPEYPSVALADVKKKDGALWDATIYGTGMYDPSWTLTTVKTMTMDEKITFWRWVMQYAKNRGIDMYMFTWNIFTYGTEPTSYGITDSHTNATTKNYFRKSVQAMFNTYPLLAGIGITAGENMANLTSDQEEQWLWDTYGLGVSDAIADAKNSASPYYAPDRKIRLVHRLHFASPSEIVTKFQSLPGASDADSSLLFSMKYSVAHMHSSTRPLFVQGDLNRIPNGKKTFLTVRNDDMYNMRWGDPDFARDYMTNMFTLQNSQKITGFYMGPDGYTWGREYLSTEPDTPRQQVIDKMWYSFLLYGRLAYEPTLPNTRFQALLRERFTELTNNNLFDGWASTSKIIPLVNRFHWGPTDYVWYPEACAAAFGGGFKTVRDFIDGYKPMQADEDGTGPLFMSVLQYVNGEAANGRLNPLQVADLLQQHAEAGMTKIQGLNAGSNKELRLTLGDIKAMASLGRYYADKIRGAVSLARYDKNGLTSDYNAARAHLLAASNHWKDYATVWSSQYNGQVLTRLGNKVIDIVALQSKVNADIPVPLPSTTPDSLPWVEDFNLPSGFRADGAPTAWQVARAGVFEISTDGKLFINGSGGEGVLTTNTIDISSGSVNLSLDVVSAGGVDAPSGSTQDYVKLFIKVNGGPEQLVNQVFGPQSTVTWNSNGIIGNQLQVIVRALVGQATEFYYLDNLKVEPAQAVTTYNLTTSATNGSVTLDPMGGVYPAGNPVSLIAVPNSGYIFSSWSGDLTGTTNPVSITMNGNKNITANFTAVTAAPDAIPWWEDFNLPLGTKSQGAPTTWTANRANGDFQVNAAGQLFINQFGGNGAAGEGVFETGEIDISGALEIKMSLSVQAAGGLDLGTDPDYVRFYKIVDGGAPVLVAPQILGGFTGTQILEGTHTGGSRLKLRIQTKVTADSEFYYFDDLKVDILRSPKKILFIAGDAALLSTSDASIVARLQSQGHTVLAINDELSTTASATGQDLVIISSSVSGSQVNTKFQGVAVPVINWETVLQDELLFTGAASSTSQGTSATQTTLNITDASHPLAGGLAAGVRIVANTTGTFSWGAPGETPLIIARLNDGTNRAAIYAYETGAAMNSGTAAARRVNLFLQNDTFVSLNADGLRLFDAAVAWATGQSLSTNVNGSNTVNPEPPSGPQVGPEETNPIIPTIIEGGQLHLEWNGSGTLQKSTNMQEPWIDVPNAVSPFVIPMTESQEFFRLKR